MFNDAVYNIKTIIISIINHMSSFLFFCSNSLNDFMKHSINSNDENDSTNILI